MINYRMWSRRLVLLLALIAFVVFIGQVLHGNVWLLICLYWLVLTLKNYVDWSGDR